MRTDVLRNFTVLADEKNMTRAARSLHISQPTLSRQMASLEDDLGKQLYTREDGIIKLTQEGLIFYEYASSIADLEARARNDLAHASEAISGSVYISYADSNSMSYVFKAISAVRKRFDQVEFNLIAGASHASMERLSQGAIDFMLESRTKPHGRYNVLQLPESDTIAAIVGPQSRLYGKKTVTPKDLEGEMLVVSRRFFESTAMREWAGDSYANMSAAVFFNLGEAFFDLAAFSEGCVIGHQEITERLYGYQLDCIPFDPPLTNKSSIVWRKDRELSPAASVFLDELKTIVAESGTN